jgi:hypothetical protein
MNTNILSKLKGGIMVLDSGCIHWWIIGNDSVGHCKKCGATRDFEKLRQEEKTRMNMRRGKRESPVVSVITL